jgi:hypothetical protein
MGPSKRESHAFLYFARNLKMRQFAGVMEGELLQTREDSHGLGRLFENDAAETTRYSLLKQLILKDFFDSSCELR